ncbi:MAG: AAA family ATPase [Thermodesulfobacteriota bacterium]|nr:AAA family ATPase [Thermodesulfobacteriota bacterium]
MIFVRLDVKSTKLLERFQKIVNSLEDLSIIEHQGSKLPDVVIFEVGPDSEKDLESVEAIQRSPSYPEIFITSASYEIMKKALKMGIREFFSEPIKKEEVEIAFARYKKNLEHGKPQKGKHGKILSMLGSKGGMGSTTVAVNLAEALAQTGDSVRICLVDLNLEFGDIPLFLDIEPSNTIADVTQNILRLDSEFLSSAMIKHDSGIYILAPPVSPEEAEIVSLDGVKQIFSLMQGMFDYIVVDSNRSLDQIAMVALGLSENVFVITQLDLASLKNAKRFVDICLNMGFDKPKFSPVINRYDKNADISLAEAEKVLSQKVFWLIPSDYVTVVTSINQGKSFIHTANSSKVTKSFKEMALRIRGKKQKMSRLWGLIK